MRPRLLKEHIWIVCIVSLLIIVAFYDVFFMGKTFKATTARPQALSTGPYGQEDNIPPFMPVHNMESSQIGEPLHQFIRKNLQKGILPLWNPHQGCGYPFISMMQLGIFFPLNFILYFAPQVYAWDALIITRFFLAGFLLYWFMRILKFQKIPSLASAIAFMLSGPMVLFQYHTANDDLVAIIVLISLEYFIQKPDKRRMCFVSLAVALTFFAGHAEHIFFTAVYGFAFFCFRLFSIRPKIADKKIVISKLFMAYFIALGLSAVVFLPFLRDYLTEFWNYHPPGIGLDSALTWGPKNRALAIAAPLFFKKPLGPHDFIYSEWWGGYLGIIPIGCAILSLFSRQKHKLNYFFATIAFLLLAKSYGMPPVQWIGYLPIFKKCIFYTHTLHLIALTVSIMVGMGVRVVLTTRRTFAKGLSWSAPLLCIFFLYLLFFPQTKNLALSNTGIVFSVCALLVFQGILWINDKKILRKKQIAAILVFAIFVELFLYVHRGRANRFDSFPKVPYIEILRNQPERARSYGVLWAFFPNTGSAYEVDDFGIAILLLSKRFVNFVNNFIEEDYFERKVNARSSVEVTPFTFFIRPEPYLDLLNVKYTVTPKRMPPILQEFAKKRKLFTHIYNKEVNVLIRRGALSRAFIAHRAFFETEENAAIERMKKLNNSLKRIIVVQHEEVPEILKELANAPAVDESEAKITKYSPNEVIIEASLENPGFLVLSDTFHPDWKAFVNGKQSKIFLTDTLIRSVFLPSGNHKVRFVFQPLSFYIGICLSAAFLLVVIFLLCATFPIKLSRKKT